MNKTLRFGFTLTPHEREAMSRLAEVEGGLSHAALIRLLIRQAAKTQGLWLTKQISNVRCDTCMCKEVKNEYSQ